MKTHTYQVSWLQLVLLLLPAVRSAASDFSQRIAVLDSLSLPLVNLIVDTALMGNSHFTSGRIAIIDPLRWAGGQQVSVYDCQLRYRGNWALNYEKKSFAVKLTDSSGKKLDVSVLGIRDENSWILDAMSFDCMRMRNRVCFDLWNSFSRTPYATEYDSRNGTLGRFVEVFLNDGYHGLYCLSDKVDRKLLGLKKAKTDGMGGVALHGLLYKCNDITYPADLLLEYGEYATDSMCWDAWELQYPEDYPSAETWQPLKDLIDFCAYENTTNEEFSRRADEWFYADNLVDYFLFCNALLLRDNIKNRFLSTRDIVDGHRYLMTPWDMDIAFGYDTFDRCTDDTVDLHFLCVAAPYARLHDNENYDFYRRVSLRWEQLRQGPLSPDSVMLRMYAYARRLDESGAWRRERDRWNGNPQWLDTAAVCRLPQVREWYERNSEAITRQLKVVTSVRPVHRDIVSPVVYDLQGRRLMGKPGKGVYIQHGKKYVME